MIRLLQLALLIALAYMAWQLVRKALAPRPGGAGGEPPRFEPTAQCARCGTYVPREQLDASGACPRCLTRA